MESADCNEIGTFLGQLLRLPVEDLLATVVDEWDYNGDGAERCRPLKPTARDYRGWPIPFVRADWRHNRLRFRGVDDGAIELKHSALLSVLDVEICNLVLHQPHGFFGRLNPEAHLNRHRRQMTK